MSSRRPIRILRRAPFLLGLVMAALSVCCQGGDGDDDTSPLPCTAISFDAANTSPVAGDVYFSPSSSTCTTVDVSVRVNEISDVFTVGFDLMYPASVLLYQSYTLGPLLQKGTATAPRALLTSGSGALQVVMTRLSPDGPVVAGANEILITLRFSKVGVGAGMIDFNSSSSSTVTEEILDDSGQTRPASFGPGHGGTVTVVP